MGAPHRTTTYAGNPTVGQDAVSAECYQPNESWAYDYPGTTRVYHFSAMSGTDDYWLIENLGAIYRCGDPKASLGVQPGGRLTTVLSPVNENRYVDLGPAAALVLQDLYRSRQGLDPRYARAAQSMNTDIDRPLGATTGMSEGSSALEAKRVLQEERHWTYADGMFAVDSVPDRPPVAGNTRLLIEELQFSSPVEGLTRVWLNAVVEAEHLQPTTLPDGSYRYRVKAYWVLLRSQRPPWSV